LRSPEEDPEDVIVLWAVDVLVKLVARTVALVEDAKVAAPCPEPTLNNPPQCAAYLTLEDRIGREADANAEQFELVASAELPEAISLPCAEPEHGLAEDEKFDKKDGMI
jgi:hypothetical protein